MLSEIIREWAAVPLENITPMAKTHIPHFSETASRWQFELLVLLCLAAWRLLFEFCPCITISQKKNSGIAFLAVNGSRKKVS